MRRHFRNHSSPAGLGPRSAPGMGVGLGMGMHEPFGPRSMLGLHGGPPGYPGPQLSHIQLERERFQRERMAMHGPPREVHPQYGPPSAYRHPPHANGVLVPPPHPPRGPPPPGIHHGAFGSYPPGFSPRESELDRRERLVRSERENWELYDRQVERERIAALERRPISSHAIQPPYALHPSAQHARAPDYRIPGEPGRQAPDYFRYPQHPARNVPSSLIEHNSPSSHSQSHLQTRPPGAGPIPALRSSHSFSHPHVPSHAQHHSRSSPSHSHSHSLERYSSASPVVSPALSSASSLPVHGWRGHAHTHSAPAVGLGRTRGIELPPLMTSARSPYSRDAALASGHGRSQSYSASGSHVDPGPPLAPPFERDEERGGRRERRDSTAALTGHESDREVLQGAISEFESEDRREDSDIEMRDAVGERSNRVHSPSAPRTTGSPLNNTASTFQENTPPSHSQELRRRPSNSQSVAISGSSSRDRSYSQSHAHYSHSRTGSGSSSGHGHGYAAHPYARARHAHSRSREAVPDTLSPRLRASLSTSPRALLPTMSTSSSPHASVSSGTSPRPLKNGVSTDAQLPREQGQSDRGSKLSSPNSASGRASRFPVYTFPPPVPPSGVMIPAASPVGSVAMEVEN